MFFPFESYSFQEFLKFSGLKSCFSRTTGNGLETDELGLAGSLACRGLCVCAVCAPTPGWVSFESYFPRNFSSFCDLKFFPGFSLFFPFESYSFQEFLKFSGLKVVLVGLLAMARRLMSWDLVITCLSWAVLSVLPFLARCYLNGIFPEISQVFVI